MCEAQYAASSAEANAVIFSKTNEPAGEMNHPAMAMATESIQATAYIRLARAVHARGFLYFCFLRCAVHINPKATVRKTVAYGCVKEEMDIKKITNAARRHIEVVSFDSDSHVRYLDGR